MIEKLEKLTEVPLQHEHEWLRYENSSEPYVFGYKVYCRCGVTGWRQAILKDGRRVDGYVKEDVQLIADDVFAEIERQHE